MAIKKNDKKEVSFMNVLERTYVLLQKELEQELAKQKCVPFSFSLILSALEQTERLSQTEIAQSLFLTEATVSRHISAMERTRLLTRKEAPENRRKHVLAITPKGKDALRRAKKIIDKTAANALRGVGAGEQAKIKAVLAKMEEKLLGN